MSLDAPKPPTPNSEAHQSTSELAPWMAAVALREPPIDNLRTEIVDGFTVRSNLPPGLLPFEPTPDGKQAKHPFSRELLPSAIDSLPNGTFTIASPHSDDPYYNRSITVIEDEGGKYFSPFIQPGLFYQNRNSIPLMKNLGYKYEGIGLSTKLSYIPTPATLKARSAELGVDVELFPDQGHIDDTTYLTTFAAGKYPVATGTAKDFIHDIQDDHLPAMVLGGEPLKLALMDAANHALEGDADKSQQTNGIDKFTAHLRGTVSPTINESPDLAYNETTLQELGRAIGLTNETVTNILETARVNAVKFEMNVN